MIDISDRQISWAVMNILFGLYESGVLKYMADQNRYLDVTKIALSTNTEDERNLSELLLFINLFYPELVEKNQHQEYYLTNLYHTDHFQNLLHFSRAYKPVLDNVGKLLIGTAQYGVDIQRDGIALGLAGEHFSVGLVKELRSLLSNGSHRAIVDLGCGTGHLVKKLTRNTNCTGVGIDKQKPSFTVHDDNFVFIEGDVGLPQEWADKLRGKNVAFVAAYVWHEFLYKDYETLKAIWRTYQDLFSGSIMYMIEYDGKSTDEIHDLPNFERNSASIYRLIHPLTKQGYPKNRRQWQEIIDSCGIISEQYSTNVFSTIYKLHL